MLMLPDCLCPCRETPEGAHVGVNRSNLLLRGCILRNTTMVVGLVVYAGQSSAVHIRERMC